MTTNDDTGQGEREIDRLIRLLRVKEGALKQLQASAESASVHNERLVRTLKDARDQIVTLKSEVDRLAQPPSGFGTIVEVIDPGTVDVLTGGRKMRVAVSPTIGPDQLSVGREVLLNEAMNVVQAHGFERVGEVVTLKEVLSDERVLVVGHTDEERVARIAQSLSEQVLRIGDGRAR